VNEVYSLPRTTNHEEQEGYSCLEHKIWNVSAILCMDKLSLNKPQKKPTFKQNNWMRTTCFANMTRRH